MSNDRAKLNSEQQVFIIQSLACFHSANQIIKTLTDEYNITLTKQAISGYDPNTVKGQSLSDEYKKLFTDTRTKYLADITTVGVANQKVRIQKLQNYIEDLEAKASPNVPLMAQLLEQVAKEMGNHYTNKREITGKDGQPVISNIQVRAVDYRTAIAETTTGSIENSPPSSKD